MPKERGRLRLGLRLIDVLKIVSPVAVLAGVLMASLLLPCAAIAQGGATHDVLRDESARLISGHTANLAAVKESVTDLLPSGDAIARYFSGYARVRNDDNYVYPRDVIYLTMALCRYGQASFRMGDYQSSATSFGLPLQLSGRS